MHGLPLLTVPVLGKRPGQGLCRSQTHPSPGPRPQSALDTALAPVKVRLFADCHTTLSDVDAVNASDVWAVGSTYLPLSGYRPATYHWDGHTWQTVASHSPSNEARLDVVSAAAPDDVCIVGESDSGQPNEPVILHWDGTAWSPR